MLNKISRGNTIIGRISVRAAVSFLLAVTLCALLTFLTIMNRLDVERLQMEQLIIEKSLKINEVISRLLYKTEALAALVSMGDGSVEDFEQAAAAIADDPAISNVIAAPNGVVAHVYPLEGNEAVLGLDYLADGPGNREAKLAVEKGQLVFGGPFETVQGGQALVGRLPVYMPSGEDKEFWGLVSVTLRYPDALSAVGLEALEKQGYTYEIWRMNPDDGSRQSIGHGDALRLGNMRYIERHIPILNADWYFRISPVRMWHEYTETWLMVFASLFISILLACVVQNNVELKLMKGKLEEMARIDPLTGAFNRRYFMEVTHSRSRGKPDPSATTYLILMDVDHFKLVNDEYGHVAGDAVLTEAIRRIKRVLRSEDLLARYGGEEFIIQLSSVSGELAFEIAERVRKAVSSEPYLYRHKEIVVTCSCGLAPYRQNESLDIAVANADCALYEAKSSGRNKTVVFENKRN